MRPIASSPRQKTVRVAALVASAAMVVIGVQTGQASAQPERSREAGATALPLTAGERATAIKAAQADASAQAESLGLGAKEKLLVRDVIKDADGTVHTRYERTYAGLPVLGGDLVVHEKTSGARSVNKATDARIAVKSTDAAVASSAASGTALKAAPKATTGEKAKSPRKVVWAATGKPVLAWETVVTGTQADGTPSELHVVTDATTGKKLSQWEGVETGSGTSKYSGTVPLGTTKSGSTYSLTDSTRGNHKTYDLNQGSSGTGTLFTDADDVWGGGRQTAGVDAHYGAAETWDFYKEFLGRNGIKNNGVGSYSRVHYGNSYVNAFWQDSCFCMTYGDGSGNANALTSMDVAGHEMSHGVTAATANLNYAGEPGGLNEATSDIMATAVEFYSGNSADVGDYLIGEKININGDGTPLRYQDKPSKDGASKDYWSSTLGNIDVHYSSGPANHFFYLLSEGSGAKVINGVSYNSPTYDGSTVTGIGRDKAIKIWYRALTTYWTSTTKYAGARTGTLSAASDLYGANSTEYKAVAAAWTAINVK
ncbi:MULTISPECIES: M4 family metallopeptidase [Streptomyces]|uniref:M4 family metallopeptidase n=1 Tax=Streptomyces TaxID=1883 RepID=UPI0015F86849|nr:M4 family metallopeptidase [Streptomyces sp. GMR22]MBA6439841.1 M4 family metallopeptidase [Streptomyces sp. GMR22]